MPRRTSPAAAADAGTSLHARPTAFLVAPPAMMLAPSASCAPAAQAKSLVRWPSAVRRSQPESSPSRPTPRQRPQQCRPLPWRPCPRRPPHQAPHTSQPAGSPRPPRHRLMAQTLVMRQATGAMTKSFRSWKLPIPQRAAKRSAPPMAAAAGSRTTRGRAHASSRTAATRSAQAPVLTYLRTSAGPPPLRHAIRTTAQKRSKHRARR
mmetsp:Transcript_43968/g.111225  ORF Transcript_43968/g.111225 Transcript_43968/m.111225 type:complete len:207 (-) Transcript_43968:363-983(-)